jgi:hypothetical protein
VHPHRKIGIGCPQEEVKMVVDQRPSETSPVVGYSPETGTGPIVFGPLFACGKSGQFSERGFGLFVDPR